MERHIIKGDAEFGPCYAVTIQGQKLYLSANHPASAGGAGERAYWLRNESASFSMPLSEEDLLHLFAGFINIKEEHYGENF